MTQIQTQLTDNSTQSTKATRRRGGGKSIKEINTLTLLKTSRYQSRTCPDQSTMLIILPGEHPISRDDVQLTWLRGRSKRPRVRQPRYSLSVACPQMAEYSSAYASAYEFGVERWLAGRARRGDYHAAGLGGNVYDLYPPVMPSTTATHAP